MPGLCRSGQSHPGIEVMSSSDRHKNIVAIVGCLKGSPAELVEKALKIEEEFWRQQALLVGCAFCPDNEHLHDPTGLCKGSCPCSCHQYNGE